MKKPVLFVPLFALLLGLPGLLSAQQGCTSGPYPANVDTADQYGYSWAADTAQGGPSYNWIDIEDPANEVTGLVDDNFVGPVDMDLDFDYYFKTYNEVYIGSNGYLMFGTGVNVASGQGPNGGFPTYPTAGPTASGNNMIGAMLADLTLVAGDGDPVPNAAVYATKTQDSLFVVTYKDVPYWSNDPSAGNREWQGRNTFQVILNGNSGDITLNYQSIDDSVASTYRQSLPGGGTPNWLTRGMENNTGQVGFCLPSRVYPGNSTAIHIDRPSSTSIQVTDLAVDWVVSDSPFGDISLTDDLPNTIDVGVENVGNTQTSQIQIILRVFDFFSSDQFTLNNAVPSLQPDQTTTVSFNLNNQLQGVSSSLFRVRAEIVPQNAGDDDFGDNNTLEKPLVTVDTAGLDDSLIYCGFDRFMFKDHYGFSSGDGNVDYNETTDGLTSTLQVGQYVTPPAYPAEVRTISWKGVAFGAQSFPEQIDQYAGFTIEVYDEQNGEPGSLIDTFQVTATEVANQVGPLGVDPQTGPEVQAFNMVDTLDSPVNLNAGEGIFISHRSMQPNQDTISNGLATDNASSASRRTFEISGGQWAEHRSNTSLDFPLRMGVKLKKGSSREDRLSNRVFEVGAAYPNPAQDQVTLPITLKHKGQVSVTVRNTTGQVVDQQQTPSSKVPGEHRIQLELDHQSAGVYLYTVEVNGEQATGRLMLR